MYNYSIVLHVYVRYFTIGAGTCVETANLLRARRDDSARGLRLGAGDRDLPRVRLGLPGLDGGCAAALVVEMRIY
jgi:hypothetical protein